MEGGCEKHAVVNSGSSRYRLEVEKFKQACGEVGKPGSCRKNYVDIGRRGGQ
jgi:hypothetical protein